MDEFKSLHYEGTYGKLLATEGQLVCVADVVRLRMHSDPLPLRPAVRMCLAALEADASVSLYVTRKADHAVKVGDQIVWKKGSKQPEDRGRAGLLARVRAGWIAATDEEGLYATIFGGQLAVLEADALRTGIVKVAAPVVARMDLLTDDVASNFKATKERNDDWEQKDYSELLRQFDLLKAGPPRLLAKVAQAKLARIWNYEPNSIRAFLVVARERAAARSNRARNKAA